MSPTGRNPHFGTKASVWPAICLALLTVIALLPVLRSPLVPLMDYPGHIARLYVLSHLNHYVGTYTALWQAYPDLAMDGFILPLVRWMGILTAGHLLVVATLVLLISSVGAIQIVLFGRIGAISILAPLLLYNRAFVFGFLGYLLTLAAALLAIAGWIASRNWYRIPRALVFTVIAVLLFLGHLFAFGVFVLVIATMAVEETWRLWRVTPLVMAALLFLPALLLFLLGPTAGYVGETQYGSWHNHFAAFASPTSTYDSTTDYIALAFVVGLFTVGLLTQKVSVAPLMRWPLAATLLAAIAMPDNLFGALSVSIRLPIALAFLAVGASRFQRCPTKVVLTASVVAVIILLVQVILVDAYWRRLQTEQKELLAALNAVTLAHEKILVVVEPMSTHHNRSSSGQPVSLTPYEHMADLVVLSHDVYLPSVFSLSGKQPLRGIGLFAKFSQQDQPQLRPADLEHTLDGNNEGCVAVAAIRPYCGWEHDFDYVVSLDFGWRRLLLPDFLSPIAEGSFFVVYRVSRR